MTDALGEEDPRSGVLFSFVVDATRVPRGNDGCLGMVPERCIRDSDDDASFATTAVRRVEESRESLGTKTSHSAALVISAAVGGYTPGGI